MTFFNFPSGLRIQELSNAMLATERIAGGSVVQRIEALTHEELVGLLTRAWELYNTEEHAGYAVEHSLAESIIIALHELHPLPQQEDNTEDTEDMPF